MTLEEYRRHLGGNLRKSDFKFWGEVCFEQRKKSARVTQR
jgi:hypothetical protein